MAEFYSFTPQAFRRPGLEHVVYGETRRDGTSPLAGNVGDTPFVLNEATYAAIKSTEPFEVWVDHEKKATDDRIQAAMGELGLNRLARLWVDHGTDSMNASERMEETQLGVAFERRPKVDSAFVTEEGDGEMFSVGDCADVMFAFPGQKIVGSTHAGFRGVIKEVIPQAIEMYRSSGLDISEAVAHISPHAWNFQLDSDEREIAAELLNNASYEARREFRAFSSPGLETLRNPRLNMRGLVLSQLHRSGISRQNISMSSIDTITNPVVFSHYNALNVKNPSVPNGRIGVVAGLASKPHGE